MSVTIYGKFGITATIIADSISKAGIRFTTYEIQYPRIILAELNTHRMNPKNSASSRAIPAAKMFEQLTGRPVRFGGNQAGMQDNGEHNALVNGYTAAEWWRLGMLSMKNFAQAFSEAGFHKQIFNRLTEPFQMMKTVISGTEWNNFFYLRWDEAADPTICELASVMKEAREASTPQVLEAGQWHLPYVFAEIDSLNGKQSYFLDDNCDSDSISLDDAIKVSCARTAAVSFRNTDYGLVKCIEVYERLVNSGKLHGSALEHAATPMKPEAGNKRFPVNVPENPTTWEDGISHMDRNYQLWSGPLRGFIQHRKTVPNENFAG
jgi:hypothetical protein